MEERYDVDTVELIDYLRVMWWGKWIILGCLVVAVGLSMLFVGLRPTTPTMYSGSTEILVREYVTAALAEDKDATTAMASAIGFALLNVENDVPDITATVAGNRITLSRSDATSDETVLEALTQAKVALERQLPPALAEEFEHLARLLQFEGTNLNLQLEILRQRLREEQASSDDSVLEALAGQIVVLEEKIAQQQVYVDTLATVRPDDLFTLSPIGEPTITTSTSESRGKTTIAFAVFLGLMIGVLLAFFVHYLVQIHERERQATKGERS